jgi:hypothetical protein
MHKTALSTLIFALLLLMAWPSQAQTEASSEVDRFLAAIKTADEYPSFLYTSLRNQTQTIEIFVGGSLSSTQITTALAEGNYQAIQGEVSNIQGLENVELTVNEDGEEQVFEINAEVRVVEGVLYVNAAGTLPDLPVDWVEVSDEDQYPALGELELEDLLEDLEKGPRVSLGNLDEQESQILRDSVLEVSRETLDDPTFGTVEVVTLTYDMEVYTALFAYNLSQEPDPLLETAISYLSEGYLIYTVAYDEKGRLIGLGSEAMYRMTDIPLEVLGGQAGEGNTVNLSVERQDDILLSEIGAELEAVSAP